MFSEHNNGGKEENEKGITDVLFFALNMPKRTGGKGISKVIELSTEIRVFDTFKDKFCMIHSWNKNSMRF